jgi:putative Mg2+ transporter-C (MgtC) family protein
MSLRILLAAVLGGIIGYERRRADKPVGLRTLVLISTGAALFTVASVYAFGDGDPARVAAGVVAGIGFLGAGVIIRRRAGGVEGITTASAIWVVAAIGLAAGVGLYLIATVTTVIVMLVLLLLRKD